MRPRSYLLAGFLCGAGLGGLVLVGPDRLSNVYCRVANCPVTATLDDICAMATAAEARAPSQRASYLAEAFAASWPTKKGRALAERVGTSAPGERFDVLLDELAADGVRGWSCPAVTRMIGAPVAASMRRIIVDGIPVVDLTRGFVLGQETDASGLAIDSLYEALRRRDTSKPLQLGLHPALPFKTIAQVVYTAGLASYDAVDIGLLNLNVPKVRVALSAYGTCNDCLVELADARRRAEGLAEPVLGVIGRRSTEPLRQDAMLSEAALRLTVALSDHGDAWIAGRGGTLPPRAGPSDGATVRATPYGPAYDEITVRLEQIRSSFPHGRGVLVTADLDTRASQFHRTLVEVRGKGGEPFDTLMLAVPLSALDRHALIQDLFQEAETLTWSTHAQLSRQVEDVPAASITALTNVRRPRRRTAPRRRDRSRERPSLARMFDPHLGSVQRCYEDGLRLNRRLSGKVILYLDVTSGGKTANVKAEDRSLGSPSVTACIEDAAKQWQLPEPDAAPLSVAYPIVLRPETI